MSLTRTKRDRPPARCCCLISANTEEPEGQDSAQVWHGTSLLTDGMTWELGHLPPVCDAKYKLWQKTLRLKDENFTGSGEWPLWKTDLQTAQCLDRAPTCPACKDANRIKESVFASGYSWCLLCLLQPTTCVFNACCPVCLDCLPPRSQLGRRLLAGRC